MYRVQDPPRRPDKHTIKSKRNAERGSPMEFLIADSFTDSLGKLTGDEQKAAKTTAFDLQMDPANPGMQFHRIDRAKDKHFWSVRVSRDIRLIVHKTEASFLLCYVGHHDDAYHWAERRKIERHPKTGAAQLVEIREMVKEIVVPKYVETEQPTPELAPLFADVPDDDLLAYGVPEEWIGEVHEATEDTIFDVAEHLPAEAAEALFDLATGATPQVVPPPDDVLVLTADTPEDLALSKASFEHPDAQRRFRTIDTSEELERALEFPWDKWTVFLHPAQRRLVEYEFNGPARVAGSAGTGKTIVALHRAVFLAKTNPDCRVLLTTFSETLANALRSRLRRLIANEPRIAERLEVYSVAEIGQRLYESNVGRLKLATPEQIESIIAEVSDTTPDQRFSKRFLLTEWDAVVDAWQLKTWEDYRDVLRLGRKTRLAETQRQKLWAIFEQVRAKLDAAGLITQADMFSRLAEKLSTSKHPAYEYAVIDEAQDISVAQLRFLAALGGDRPNALFFAGDLGQRIFQQPFSWKALGVDVRGRSKTLHINYRTSHQIRSQADRLLAPELADVDGITEERRGTISVFNGPAPAISIHDTPEEEAAAVGKWIKGLLNDGTAAHEIAVFVRSNAQIERGREALVQAGVPFIELSPTVETKTGSAALSTMHLAKGLEFRAVAVMACDDEVIPLQERIETVTDSSDLDEVYNTERHLLYVACTRARDRLLVTGVDPASEFLDDLTGTQ